METADLSGVVEDLAGADLTGADLTGTTPGDMVGNQMGDLGGAGAPCMSACDCMPGLGCFAGNCVAGVQPVYCCTAANCPANSNCQRPDKTYGRCGSSATDGGFDVCPFINCQNGMQACTNAGCSMCVKGPGPDRCAK